MTTNRSSIGVDSRPPPLPLPSNSFVNSPLFQSLHSHNSNEWETTLWPRMKLLRAHKLSASTNSSTIGTTTVTDSSEPDLAWLKQIISWRSNTDQWHLIHFLSQGPGVSQIYSLLEAGSEVAPPDDEATGEWKVETESDRYKRFCSKLQLVGQRYAQLIHLLISVGVNVDEPIPPPTTHATLNGSTPLMLAIAGIWLPGVLTLLSLGANTHAVDSDGATPILYSLRYHLLFDLQQRRGWILQQFEESYPFSSGEIRQVESAIISMKDVNWIRHHHTIWGSSPFTMSRSGLSPTCGILVEYPQLELVLHFLRADWMTRIVSELIFVGGEGQLTQKTSSLIIAQEIHSSLSPLITQNSSTSEEPIWLPSNFLDHLTIEPIPIPNQGTSLTGEHITEMKRAHQFLQTSTIPLKDRSTFHPSAEYCFQQLVRQQKQFHSFVQNSPTPIVHLAVPHPWPSQSTGTYLGLHRRILRARWLCAIFGGNRTRIMESSFMGQHHALRWDQLPSELVKHKIAPFL